MGNRGGRIHTRDKKIRRNWANKQWICCVTEFKGRARTVMGESYTELFFLDEATALAAGHRPCFECRRKEAVRFAEFWAQAHKRDSRAKAAEMDAILHKQRLTEKECLDYTKIPSNTIFRVGEDCFLKTKDGARRWSFAGYHPVEEVNGPVEVLTCRSIRAIFEMGYQPLIHPSAITN